MQFGIRVSLLALMALTAACSQSTPAEVVLKGQMTYGRNSVGMGNSAPLYSYNYSGPASGKPVSSYTTSNGSVTENAGIQPVGVHDLASMSPAAGSPTFNTAVASTPTAPSVSSLSASSSPSPVNQWTRQPHFSAGESAPAATTKQPVAQLDSLISNDGSKAHIAKAEKTAFMWPVTGRKIISGFGPKGDGKTNDGINIAAGEGEPVWASADGEIVYVGNELAGYGNMVLIKHPGNKTTAYAHLSRATVDKYDRIKQGDIIGYVGTTGNVKEPQLHFAIRDGKDPVDPAKYFSKSLAAN